MKPFGSPTTPSTACRQPLFSRDIKRAMAVGRAHRGRHLPHQRPDRRRRGTDAVRWRQGSGYGRFGGKASIAEFTDLRWVTIGIRASITRSDPAWHWTVRHGRFRLPVKA